MSGCYYTLLCVFVTTVNPGRARRLRRLKQCEIGLRTASANPRNIYAAEVSCYLGEIL